MIPTFRAHPSERKRLSRQADLIVERLRQGIASNRELAAISLKYTSRISEARQAGYRIEVQSQDHRSGLVTYALVTKGQMEMFG